MDFGETRCNGVDLIQVVHDRIQCRAFLKKMMNLRVLKRREFRDHLKINKFSTRILYHGGITAPPLLITVAEAYTILVRSNTESVDLILVLVTDVCPSFVLHHDARGFQVAPLLVLMRF
jgi:hypothetical protein